MTGRTATDQDTMQAHRLPPARRLADHQPRQQQRQPLPRHHGKAHVAAAKSAHNPLGRSANGMGDNAVVGANDRVARDDYDHRRGPCRGVVTVEAGYRDGVLR